MNLGSWANGAKLDLGGSDSDSANDIESDFMCRVKQGDVPWMCQHCLKRKERNKPCECEESNGLGISSLPGASGKISI